jgi:hypothetical protein
LTSFAPKGIITNLPYLEKALMRLELGVLANPANMTVILKYWVGLF